MLKILILYFHVSCFLLGFRSLWVWELYDLFGLFCFPVNKLEDGVVRYCVFVPEAARGMSLRGITHLRSIRNAALGEPLFPMLLYENHVSTRLGILSLGISHYNRVQFKGFGETAISLANV